MTHFQVLPWNRKCPYPKCLHSLPALLAWPLPLTMASKETGSSLCPPRPLHRTGWFSPGGFTLLTWASFSSLCCNPAALFPCPSTIFTFGGNLLSLGPESCSCKLPCSPTIPGHGLFAGEHPHYSSPSPAFQSLLTVSGNWG